MATIQQIDDLYRFAKQLPERVRGELSVEQILEQWRALHGEDLQAIAESLEDFDNGERGQLAEEYLAQCRAERTAGEMP